MKKSLKEILQFANTIWFKIALMVLQMAIVVLCGVFGGDVWYAILISIVGIIFNMLVSFNISYGFLFGFVYAIANGVYMYFAKTYATFGFMIVLQAPMAIYSFYSWQKNKNNKKSETQLKIMSKKMIAILAVFVVAVAVGSYFLLKALNSANIIPDTIFFVFSVTACILLALRYRNAYIVTLFSGLGGTILYTFQMITQGIGLSIAAFYGLVTINSVIAIVNNYKKSRAVYCDSENRIAKENLDI